MIDTTAEKLVCEIITTRSEELPKLNDLCSNSVHPFFIWTQNHIEGDVLKGNLLIININKYKGRIEKFM